MIVFLCLYLFLSVVLSGLCSNDCPENVKVSSDLFFSLSLYHASHSAGVGMACVWHHQVHMQSVPADFRRIQTPFIQCSTQSLSIACSLIEYFSLSMFSFFFC